MSEWSVHHRRSTCAAACCWVCQAIDAGRALPLWLDHPWTCNAADIEGRCADPTGERMNPDGGSLGGGVTFWMSRQPNTATRNNRNTPPLAAKPAATRR